MTASDFAPPPAAAPTTEVWRWNASEIASFDAVGFERELAAAPSPIAPFRTLLKQGNTQFKELFLQGVPAYELAPARARWMDELLRRAWSRFFEAEALDLALVAVGGYGRGELHPGSDVDLMVLLGDQTLDARRSGLEDFLTFLWDIGLEVGHSVRTVEDCAHEGAADITVATSLMEARLLTGSLALFEQMRAVTGPDRIWPDAAFFESKQQERQQRCQRYNETAFNLEPNIKEGPGGLRDLQMIGWVTKRHFGASTLRELVDHGFLSLRERQHLGMGGGVLEQLDLVESAGDGPAVADHDRADGHFLGLVSAGRLPQGFAHEVVVALQVDDAGEVGDVVLHHVETHPAAGEGGDLASGGEARQEDQVQDLPARQVPDRLGRGEPALEGDVADPVLVDPGAVVLDHDLDLVPLLGRREPDLAAGGFRAHHGRQALQIGLHLCRDFTLELAERLAKSGLEGDAGQRLDQPPAQVERAQLRQREPQLREVFERMRVELPERVVVARFVDEGEPGLLQGEQVPVNRPRMDPGRVGHVVDRQPVVRGLDGPQDVPLADDFGVSRHGLPPGGPVCSRAATAAQGAIAQGPSAGV